MERKYVYRVIGAGIATGAAIFGWRALHNRASSENLVAPRDTKPLATPTVENPAEAEAETEAIPPREDSSGTAIINGMTGAIYQIAPDPERLSRQCVRLGRYNLNNKQDVTGAAVALGPDPAVYVDISGGVVYSPAGTLIGSFTPAILPSEARLGNVQPGTVVCVNGE